MFFFIFTVLWTRLSFSVCSIVVFSGRALTIVLQKFIITNTFYDLILQRNLCGDLKANFSIGFILFLCSTTFRFIQQLSRICCCLCKDCHTYEIIRMQFSSRTLKIVRTFLDRGSVTKKLFTILVYIKKRKIAKLGNWNLLFY